MTHATHSETNLARWRANQQPEGPLVVKIVIEPSTSKAMERHAIGGRLAGTVLPGIGIMVEVDREVILALFDQVPVGDSWDEVIKLLVLSKGPKSES